MNLAKNSKSEEKMEKLNPDKLNQIFSEQEEGSIVLSYGKNFDMFLMYDLRILWFRDQSFVIIHDESEDEIFRIKNDDIKGNTPIVILSMISAISQASLFEYQIMCGQASTRKMENGDDESYSKFLKARNGRAFLDSGESDKILDHVFDMMESENRNNLKMILSFLSASPNSTLDQAFEFACKCDARGIDVNEFYMSICVAEMLGLIIEDDNGNIRLNYDNLNSLLDYSKDQDSTEVN